MSSLRSGVLLVILALGSATAPARSQVLTNLSDFGVPNTGVVTFLDGAIPNAGLVRGPDGNYYGVTEYGGRKSEGGLCWIGCGTVYRIAPSGDRETVHVFRASQGEGPSSRLLLGRDGSFYGTTYGLGPWRGGTIFRLKPDGTEFGRIHAFALDGAQGSNPQATLAQDRRGMLYGVTTNGGAFGWGIVFKMAPNGSGFVVLHSFDAKDGIYPNWVQIGSDGKLYGTTLGDGPDNIGIVFSMRTDGSAFTFVHVFHGNGLGCQPAGGLLEIAAGRFIGTGGYCGSGPYGAIFTVASDGSSFSILHTFTGDGDDPSASGLTLGPDGRLYGMTGNGGPSFNGTIYTLSPDGSGFATLYIFPGPPGGASPNGRLAPSIDGRTMYGVTYNGGRFPVSTTTAGTAFAFTLGPQAH